MKDSKRIQDFLRTTKKKLSSTFRVSYDKIIIHSLSLSFILIKFSVKYFDPNVPCNLSSNLKNSFQTFLKIDLHVSFMSMEINESSFSP
jgi:DNA polymerase II small subunit/DNA polymerase delta subunit B